MRNPEHPLHAPADQLISAWSLRGWPPVLWPAGHSSALHLRHLGTRITILDERLRRTAGQTIWAARSAEGEAGVAWDWVQMPRGLVAMVDPMCVVTNIRIIGDEGEVLTAFEAARVLNEIVYTLPWQDEVQRALRTAH
jgi:hypothetical protein